jgi:hypothetical protein
MVETANDIYCSKCNKPAKKINLICNDCFDFSMERVLAQARSGKKYLQEKLEETEAKEQALRREAQGTIWKLEEKNNGILAELDAQKAILSRLYQLISEAYFVPFQIRSLFFIADVRNLASILAKGILSRNQVEVQGISHQSFADKKIQTIRARISLGSKSGHDYVPLFFEPKPPMLFRLQKEYQEKSNQNKLIYICVRKEILMLATCLFITQLRKTSALQHKQGHHKHTRVPQLTCLLH